MKILTVLGTRPEIIKMAPLVKKISQDKYFKHKICVTAQHRAMSDQFLSTFKIYPDYDLDIMTKNQSLHSVTSKILVKLKKVLDEYKPDLVLVHGDTNTAFSAALAAFYSNIEIGHVEAGLRSYNMLLPFPEEANRVQISKLATYHFAPTSTNVSNLLKEGVPENKIIKTGNTVIDSLLKQVAKTKKATEELKNSKACTALESNDKIILVTGHRRENIGQGFVEICEALLEISEKYKDVNIIYPVHLNPRVRETVYSIIGNQRNIHLIDPVTYPSFVYLMKKSYLILTDSGGIQEEAISINKPVLIMREVTERPEALIAGAAKLTGTNKAKIIESVSELIDNKNAYSAMSKIKNPYGDGKACDKIIKYIKKIKK